MAVHHWRPRLILILLLLSIGCFYGWTALTPHSGQKVNGKWSEWFYQRAPTGYEQLAESLRLGQLSLPELPNPELLALEDPYDPSANSQLRKHDWVLYEGKYYLYWSPLPALLLFLPANLLNLPMNAALACILLSFLLLIALLVLTLRATSTRISERPAITILCALILGFGSYAPILLRRPAAYEVAILLGVFLATISLLLLPKALSHSGRPPIFASCVSLLAMLSFWSRPSMLFAPLVTAAIMMYHHRTNLRQILVAIGLPVLSIALLMGAYNFIRFDSPFEFGSRYQLSGVRPTPFSLDWVIPKLHSDFLATRFFAFYPWVTTADSPFRATLYPSYNLEQNLGLLIVLPWSIPILVVAWRRRREIHERLGMAIWSLLGGLGIVCGAWLVQLISVSGTTWRYVGDIAPLFVALALSLSLVVCKTPIELGVPWGLALSFALVAFWYFNANPLLLGLSAGGALLLSVLIDSSIRRLRFRVNGFLYLTLAAIWTVCVIGLTSLTVGGFDVFNLMPYGFYWWEI